MERFNWVEGLESGRLIVMLSKEESLNSGRDPEAVRGVRFQKKFRR